MVSRYCQDAGDWKGAIEFLLMAKRTSDAFNLAKTHGQMDVFTKVCHVMTYCDDGEMVRICFFNVASAASHRLGISL